MYWPDLLDRADSPIIIIGFFDFFNSLEILLNLDIMSLISDVFVPMIL